MSTNTNLTEPIRHQVDRDRLSGDAAQDALTEIAEHARRVAELFETLADHADEARDMIDGWRDEPNPMERNELRREILDLFETLLDAADEADDAAGIGADS